MRGKCVLAIVLVGLAALLVSASTSPVAPEAGGASGAEAPEASPDFGQEVRFEWTSWRAAETPDSSRRGEPRADERDGETPARLRHVLDGLHGVDVYVEGGRDGQ